MGFMDKFKNLFLDEEIIEEDINESIEIKEIKKEEPHKLPTFMRERLESEEKPKVKKEKKDINIENEFSFQKELIDLVDDDAKLFDNDIKKPDVTKVPEEKKSFKFPLEFSDDDFIETRSRHKTHSQNMEKMERMEKLEANKMIKPKEISKEKQVKVSPAPTPEKKNSTKVSELYKEKKEVSKKFKATPIISPIYGVLNKNYNSEEVACIKGENFEEKRHSKNVDFDSVRKKAYGNITKEIKENLMCENCEYLKEAKECQKLKQQAVEDNMVYEALNEVQDAEYDYYSNITLDEATENYYDRGVEYEKKPVRYSSDVMINNREFEEKSYNRKSVPPVRSSINLMSTLKKSMGEEEEENKNLELTDDLFNLIDSMYDERND